MARRPLTALAAALALTVTLGGCNAMREQTSGTPRNEDDVPVTRAVKEAVLAALPDAVDTHSTHHLDGFALQLTVTVVWPAETALDAAAVRAGAIAICENLEGFDLVRYGFHRDPDGRFDLETLWPEAFPDAADAVRDTDVRIWEDDCAALLAA
ncbi:hypothetical protein [Cellulomonas wangsupingiae]|uniref:Lipoprotein n=1 Tax=Cellulomonas wangsupingiae TaxID=2968085 RepID=A0ABY5K617_9CELL|nr:hypothetical protein [Cellulomonas wangsupingiae]MCC2334203.1 hypothetical protein [Cellulomonas wangsupingiae]UUI65881.1 hypothetical protein NP075_03870 [Cellulomonas wangsupingiae]